MAPNQRKYRHLPPSAVPVTRHDLRAGLTPSSDAVEKFRTAVAAYFSLAVESCYLASSGRTVLYTLLKGLAAERSPRHQVIIPAYTCPVVAKVTLDLGLEPVYVDIQPETTRYMTKPFYSAIGGNTLAVLLVHPFGIPLPLDDVLERARGVGAVVIEDAAQAMGAQWAGQPVGLGGDFALFSLGPGKPLSTGGGGIVITGQTQNQAALARWWADLPPASGLVSAGTWLRQFAFRLAFHPRGWWAATRVGLQHMGNDAASWGYTIRDLSSSQAEIGRELMQRLDEINERRRKVARRLAAVVEKAPAFQNLLIEEQAEPIYLRFPLLAESEALREQLFARMWAAGIGAGRLYEKTLPEIFTPGNRANFPGAQSFARRLLTLPTHYHVSEAEIAIMEEVLADY
jgi:perosamine synthetase